MRCSDAGCWRSAMKKSARPGSGECWRQPAHLSSACITCGPANATKNSKQVRFGCARESLKLSCSRPAPRSQDHASFITAASSAGEAAITARVGCGCARAGDSAPQRVVLARPDERAGRQQQRIRTTVELFHSSFHYAPAIGCNRCRPSRGHGPPADV